MNNAKPQLEIAKVELGDMIFALSEITIATNLIEQGIKESDVQKIRAGLASLNPYVTAIQGRVVAGNVTALWALADQMEESAINRRRMAAYAEVII